MGLQWVHTRWILGVLNVELRDVMHSAHLIAMVAPWVQELLQRSMGVISWVSFEGRLFLRVSGVLLEAVMLASYGNLCQGNIA